MPNRSYCYIILLIRIKNMDMEQKLLGVHFTEEDAKRHLIYASKEIDECESIAMFKSVLVNSISKN